MTILFFCIEIYAQSYPSRVLVYKNRACLSVDNLILLLRNICLVLAKACYIALKQRAYLSDDNLILLQRNIYLVLSKACYITLKRRTYLSDDNLILLYRKRAYSWPSRVLVYYNIATTFRMTILFFYIEIYAQSQPRRVLYTKMALAFRLTILFFYREIYSQSQPRRVILH